MNNKGFTLIEVLITLSFFITLSTIFYNHNYINNQLAIENKIKEEIGIIAKNKMEELKSGYIYIDNNKHHILNLEETVNFKEQSYNINISITPLHNYENMKYINLKISDENNDIFYNLVRYINLNNIILIE